MLSIDKFIKAVQEEKFVQAHELLEEDWKKFKKTSQKQNAKALQGLINGATALALYKKGRIDAYIKIWAVFEKYKPLLDIVTLDNIDRFHYAKELLENKRQSITN